MFETYDDFTDELQLIFSNIMDRNDPEDVEDAVAAIIESDELEECKEYFIDQGNSEEEWEEMLVEMCQDNF